MSEASLLERLDSIPQIKAFDAFPKVQRTYATRSSRGGIFTLVVSAVLLYLTWYELGAYLYGHPTATFGIDHSLSPDMQVNVDLTVAMKCHCELRRPSKPLVVRVRRRTRLTHSSYSLRRPHC